MYYDDLVVLWWLPLECLPCGSVTCFYLSCCGEEEVENAVAGPLLWPSSVAAADWLIGLMMMMMIWVVIQSAKGIMMTMIG